ncbi:MAG TPA: type II CAAX endopeptidase family protein [Actinomycetales bacterium]|nr:type II CAAX endopeptidase family protein [Actinomycetales bacterium]
MTQPAHIDTEHERPSLLQRHPVGTFFALTYATAWVLWLPLVILQDRMPAGPGLLLAVLGSLMPSTLAILLVWRLQGRGEVRRLLRRLLMARVSVGWYAAIVALAALMVFAVWVSTMFGAPTPVVAVTVPGLLSLFLFSVFPGSATGEELGWRGFALPRLQARHSALAASLVVGSVWGTYHFPLFLLGAPIRPFSLFFPFALSCVIMSVFYTWMYNGTRGSLFIAVLLHAATNLPLTVVYAPLERRVLPAYWIFVGMLALAAAALIARAGTATLSRSHPKQTVEGVTGTEPRNSDRSTPAWPEPAAPSAPRV